MEANAKKNLVDVLFSILRLLPAFLDYTDFIEINFIDFKNVISLGIVINRFRPSHRTSYIVSIQIKPYQQTCSMLRRLIVPSRAEVTH